MPSKIKSCNWYFPETVELINLQEGGLVCIKNAERPWMRCISLPRYSGSKRLLMWSFFPLYFTRIRVIITCFCVKWWWFFSVGCLLFIFKNKYSQGYWRHVSTLLFENYKGYFGLVYNLCTFIFFLVYFLTIIYSKWV